MVACPIWYSFENSRLTGKVRPIVIETAGSFWRRRVTVGMEVEIEQDCYRHQYARSQTDGSHKIWRLATPEDLFQIKLSAELK